MTEQEAVAAIVAVMEKHPDLGASGFGPIHMEDRAKMLREDFVDQFVRSLAFVDACYRYKTARGHHSYALKHVAEKTHGGYIANGMLIAAAVHRGIPFVKRDGPNAILPLREPGADLYKRWAR